MIGYTVVLKMSELIFLDDNRKHVNVEDIDNNIHVIPLSVFNDIITGKISVIDLEDYEKIIPVIISEWLVS